MARIWLGAAACVMVAALLPLSPCQAETVVAAGAPQVAAKPAGRVGSLSPDEQRRAARGRERAAAAEKVAREKAEAALVAQKPAEPKPAQGAPAPGRAVAAASAEARTGHDAPLAAAGGVAPEVTTHRSVAEPAHAEAVAAPAVAPAAAPAAAPAQRRAARLHRAPRSRYAAGEPQVGDRIPDGAELRPLPSGRALRRVPRYDRVAEGDRYPMDYARPMSPWGYRPAYAPPYPFYRQGW